MDRCSTLGILCGTLLAGGIASLIGVTAVPADSPYFEILLWFGMAASAVGALGLVALAIWPAKKPPPPEASSTTARARGKGRIHLENSYSNADTFANVEDAEVIGRNTVHDPARIARRPAANGANDTQGGDGTN
jgi:hypothetical protein